jgi:hypothetical protein
MKPTMIGSSNQCQKGFIYFLVPLKKALSKCQEMLLLSERKPFLESDAKCIIILRTLAIFSEFFFLQNDDAKWPRSLFIPHKRGAACTRESSKKLGDFVFVQTNSKRDIGQSLS